MDQGARALVPQTGQERGGVDVGLQLLAFEEDRGRAVGAGPGLGLAEPGHLVGLGGDVQLARALEVAVDAELGDGRLDGVEVLGAEALQDGDLLGEPLGAVGQAVGEARRAEPAVATRCRPPAAVALQQHHVTTGVVLFGQECRPQPGVAAPHHHQVGPPGADQGRGRLGCVGVVQPERQGTGVGERRDAVHGAKLPADGGRPRRVCCIFMRICA